MRRVEGRNRRGLDICNRHSDGRPARGHGVFHGRSHLEGASPQGHQLLDPELDIGGRDLHFGLRLLVLSESVGN